ncbi:hypothetical protein [Crenothrix sp.]|uniref:hypothetical protein n=1 Tax=Crenothrix sp. TaxID=3100433 RepID=UPI00374D34E4
MTITKPPSKKTPAKTSDTEQPKKVKAVSKKTPGAASLSKSSAASEPPANVETVEVDAKKYKKDTKNAKVKIIRDSFPFPEQDYAILTELKNAFMADGIAVKRGEILRAGLHLLTTLNVFELQQVVGQVERIEKIKKSRLSSSGNDGSGVAD